MVITYSGNEEVAATAEGTNPFSKEGPSEEEATNACSLIETMNHVGNAAGKESCLAAGGDGKL